MRILFSWLVTTVAILIVTQVMRGVQVSSVGVAVVAAAILGILNALVRPILIFLTLPLTIVTFGLFLFVINALLFWLAGAIVPGFRVDSFGSALIGSLIVSVISLIVHSIFL
jgi:putative membrane protein